MYRTDFFTVETNWGWVAVAGNRGTVTRLLFGYESEAAALDALACDTHVGGAVRDGRERCWDVSLADRITAFAAGVPVEFDDVEVDTSDFTPFGQRVVKKCRRIAYGQTLSYGQLARVAGRPRAARAVGNVMAQNRVPLIVPCHRVIASGGQLGGYGAAAGLETKRMLLELEGSLPAAKAVTLAFPLQTS
ncbi:MAG: MGMT family protein [Pirellulales bacterium]|nr:MGMT family protein [Planctomycetales bacterium]